MVNQVNETVFVTGKGAKDKVLLIWGLVSIASLFILAGIAGSAGGIVTLTNVPVGIVFLVNYFRFQHMYIQVTNLRIMGKAANGNVDIPLSQIQNVKRGLGSTIAIKYISPTGKLKTARFPKMEDSEQIYNAIYSLVFAPPIR